MKEIEKFKSYYVNSDFLDHFWQENGYGHHARS